ncbi:DUF3343 domain-containing protein [Clostridium sp. DL1XJH146]
MNSKIFYVVSFDSTSHAIKTEKLLQKYFKIAVIPTPREITRNCGLSIKIFSLDIEEIINVLKEVKIPYGLYSLSEEKTEGKREISQII